jgi:LuxR family maltose regulon positive regulatory protein
MAVSVRNVGSARIARKEPYDLCVSFAAGKIQAPQPRRGLLIARPALEQRLAQAIDTQRAVLLVAPAGYGKTAALVRVLAQRSPGCGAAWVSLDPGDDLHRLLQCLFAALEVFDPPWRTAPEGLIANALRGDARSRQQTVDELVNTLDACDAERGLIVLDDLHHFDDTAGWHFLERLLERLGQRWSVVLASRDEPALALARLAAAGELARFGEADLRFSADEAQTLFSHAGLDSAVVQALHARTAGWAAGLRLALTGARGAGAGSAIDRPAFDFLATEVLARIDPDLRSFLLETSALHELDAERCEALTGDTRAARWLDEIERRGLFASVVGDGGQTLRLHDLFRDALQHRLRVERPDNWRDILRRAAGLEPDPLRRHQLLLAAHCHDDAAEALLDAGTALNLSGAAPTTLRLAEAFPPDFAAGSAVLQRILGNTKLTLWRMQEAEVHFERAETLYAARGDHGWVQAMRVRRAQMMVPLGRLAECAAILDGLRDDELVESEARLLATTARMWLLMERGQSRSVAAVFERLVEQLQPSRVHGEWSIIPPPRQTACPGMAAPVLRWAQGALAVVGDRPVPLRAMAQVALGWRAVWLGRPHDAGLLLQRALGDAQWAGHEVIVHNHATALRAVLALLNGDGETAVQQAQQRLLQHPAGYGDWGLWHALYFVARIAASARRADVLRDTLERLAALQQTLPEVTPARLAPVAGLRGALAEMEGRVADAHAYRREVLADEEAADLFGAAGEVRVRLAALALQQGAPRDAAALLQPLLDRADDGPRGAVFAPDALASLAGLEAAGVLDAASLATLRAWTVGLAQPATASTAAGARVAARAAADGGLTGRELEVVSLIARGQSNKLIARSLALSPHTVKRHIANALGKLDLTSRGQAAAWYHAQHYRA